MSWHLERRTIFANSLIVDLLWRARGGKARRLVDSDDVEVRFAHIAAHMLSHTPELVYINWG
jgi:hypothetical protein